MVDKSRAPVQGDMAVSLPVDHPARKFNAKSAGWIDWSEHVLAWEGYAKKYGRYYQSAERVVERGGFGYEELQEFLGRDPKTWRKR